MVKLCYQNNGRNTEEFYFDLQSQKVYKICLSAYYAKRNTKGIPWLFLSGGILATLLEQVLQRVLLPISVRMLLLFLVIGGLVLVNKKVKQSFIEKYQYVEEHTIGNSMEKEEILKLYTLGKWNRRALGFIVLIGLLAFLYWVVSYHKNHAPYRSISGFLRWNYWDYLFQLWRIYGGGKSKKISTDRLSLTWFGGFTGTLADFLDALT